MCNTWKIMDNSRKWILLVERSLWLPHTHFLTQTTHTTPTANDDRLLWPNPQRPLQRHMLWLWQRHIHGTLSMHWHVLSMVRIMWRLRGCPSTPTNMLIFNCMFPDFKKAFICFKFISSWQMQFQKESIGLTIIFLIVVSIFPFSTLSVPFLLL